MTAPEINPITKDVEDFVAGIEDEFVKAKLQDLIMVAQQPRASGPYARDVALVSEATERWQLAVANQKASINRLLGYNMDAGIKIRNLERALEAEKRWRERKDPDWRPE